MRTGLKLITGSGLPFRRGRLPALIALICVLGYAAPGTGAVYKWTDEQGNVHYSSEPPQDIKPERMKIDIPPPVKTSKPKPDEAEDGQQQKTEGQPQQAQPEEPKLSRADKAKLCKNARDRLQNAQTYARLRVSDEKGENRVISEQERQQRISQARKDVREFCR